MHAEDMNRIALVGFGSILFAMLVVAFSNLVFAPGRPAVPGYALPTGTSAPAPAAAAAAPPEEPLPALLAKADAKKGAQDAKICTTCHNFDKGGAAEGRPAALWRRRPPDRLGCRLRLFRFAEGCRRRLDLRGFNKMITNPKSEASGTKMAFPGEADAAQARRHPGLSADAQRLAGSVPEVSAAASSRQSAGIGNRRERRAPARSGD